MRRLQTLGTEEFQIGERAVSVTKAREPIFLGTLGAAYAEAGRFDDAIKAGEKARDLAKGRGMKELAERNEQLLQEYRAGKPHREPLQTGTGR